MKITEHVPVEVNVYRSQIDGGLVIELDVDNDDRGQDTRLKVLLNDGPLYIGEIIRDSSPTDILLKIREELHGASELTTESRDEYFDRLLTFKAKVSQLLYPMQLEED